MSDFTVNIDSRLDLSKARTELNNFINKEHKIKLNLDMSGIRGNKISEQLQKSMQASLGNSFDKSYTTALQKQINEIAKTQRSAFSEPLKNISKYEQSYSDMYNKLLNKAPASYGQNKQLAAPDEYLKQVEVRAQKAQEIKKKISQGFLEVESSSVGKTVRKYSGSDSSYFKELEQSYTKLLSLQKELTTGVSDDGSSRTLYDRHFIEKYNQFYDILTKCRNEAKILNNEMSGAFKPLSESDAINASNKTLKWLQDNTRAAKEYGEVLTSLAQKQATTTDPSVAKDLASQVKNLQSEAGSKGLTGKSFKDELVRSFKAIGQFAYTYGAIQFASGKIRESITELKEIDSILTEISKTSDLTNSQLKKLGETAFDSASKYGKTASDYLTGVQEMSRSGFYGDQAEELAQLSILAQAAGDMTADVSNSYLLATNAAYEYEGSVEKLNAALDGQNMITNRHSVSMDDMASATTEAASMASQYGVEVDELSALIGTAVSRTKKSGNEIGTSLKSLFVNLQNTQNSKITSTFEELGISMTEMVGDMKLLKDPIELLRELADAFNALPEGSEMRANILTNIGGKYHANVLSSILTGIDTGDFDTMLQDYSEGMGSAAVEAEKSENNWEGSLNKLSNAWTSLIQNFADSDTITTAINGLTTLTKGVDKFASLPTLMGLIGGAWSTKKGLGKTVYNALSYKVA